MAKETDSGNFRVGFSEETVAVANSSGKGGESSSQESGENISSENQISKVGENFSSENSFSKKGEKLKVNLYLVPTSQENIFGAPIAFTCDFETSKIFLEKALSFAKSKLAEQNQNAKTSDSLSNSISFEQLNSVIQNAQNLLENSSINSATILNYEMYLLYLALNGTQDDIGAQFANYNFAGFLAE